MYPRKPFRQFMTDLRWKQGEHVLLAAPSGCGKTTLAAQLVQRRNNVVVLNSKPKDPDLLRLYRGYHKISEWPPDRDDHRILLTPRRTADLRNAETVQRIAFKECLDSVGVMGGFCVVVDEGHWCVQHLRLDREIAILHHQGRSAGISMMTLTQRPAWIPRIIYASSTHAFIGKTRYPEDAKALSGMAGIDAKKVVETLVSMDKHDMLYINPLGDAETVVINTRK